MEKQVTNDLQLDIQNDIADGKYSNLTLITHSNSEFVLDFATILPGLEKPKVQSRIIMSPENSKRLLLALQENLESFERKYGEIKLNRPESKKEEKDIFIPPIGGFKGEA